MSKWFAPWRGTFAYSRDESSQFVPFGSRKQDGRKEMQDSERIMLSAVEKWTKYGRFPYKLILHSTILMLVTIQVRQCIYTLRWEQKELWRWQNEIESCSGPL
jgi:hypothetical protein